MVQMRELSDSKEREAAIVKTLELSREQLTALGISNRKLAKTGVSTKSRSRTGAEILDISVEDSVLAENTSYMTPVDLSDDPIRILTED